MPAILLSILASRVGQIGLAFVIGYGLAWWKTDHNWREKVAAEHAAQDYALRVERLRQQDAARELAAEATKRLEEELAASDDMRKQIEDLRKSEAKHAPVKNCPACVVDDDYLQRLHKLDSANRKTKPARRP